MPISLWVVKLANPLTWRRLAVSADYHAKDSRSYEAEI